ncbi:MAG TPA: hypothetical protein VIR63_04545 [Pontiella sp.]
MERFAIILFWLGIVMMVDGSFGLLFLERWKKLSGGLDIQRIALVEISVSIVLVVGHYLLRLNLN